MNRRGFLKSFGAIAALVVAGPALAKLTPIENASLVGQMRDFGVIENQTFIMDGPVVINASNLTICNCTFLFRSWPAGLQPMITLADECKNVAIVSCSFKPLKG